MEAAHVRLRRRTWMLNSLSIYRTEQTMQVISRQKGESLVIGDDIIITVVEIQGDKVRLGVEAPKEVPGHRRKVFDAIQQADSPSE